MENTKAVTKVCTECGSEFEHVQLGRGRPPLKCPTCRNAPKRPVGRPRKEKEKVLVAVDGPIVAGDTVVRPLDVYKNRAHAIQYATPVQVVDVEGEKAHVNYFGEILPQPVANLVKVGWSG